MKIKDGFRLRTLLGQHIVTAEGMAQINFNKLVSLNESAAFLWQKVEGREFSVQDLADALVEEYGIDAETALRDSGVIAQKWIDAGLVEK